MSGILPPIIKYGFIELHGESLSIVTEHLTTSSDLLAMSQNEMTSSFPHFQALAFTTSGKISFFRLASRGSIGHPDFNLAQMFPNGCYSTRITTIPGANWKILQDWRIFVTNHIATSPPNAAIKEIFSKDWCGNVIIAKHDQFLDDTLDEIEIQELDLAVSLVARWFENFERLESRLRTNTW